MKEKYKIMYSSGVTWEYVGTLLGAKKIATKYQTYELFKKLSDIVIFDKHDNIVAYKKQNTWMKQ